MYITRSIGQYCSIGSSNGSSLDRVFTHALSSLLSRSCYRYRSLFLSVRTSIGCVTIVRGTIGQLWWCIHAWPTVKSIQNVKC